MTEPSERLLILETSGRVGQVAVAVGEVLKQLRRLNEARRHARDLAPAVAELLAEQGWRARDLDAVIVSRGPGSYTGLRVGIISAKTLAYAAGCALIAVETFAAIARQAPPEALCLDVLADAQQDRVYVQRFARPAPGAPLEAISSLAIRPLSEWLTALESHVWVTGPGLRGNEGRLPSATPVVRGEDREPQPVSLLQIGLQRYRSGQREDCWKLEPLYLRPSSAEEKWADKG